MSNNYLISDAAKQVKVEAHVLRYWEEELELPIKRNELGHRYYTAEDVERFREIKGLKERGLQLKAIRMIMKDGKLNMLVPDMEVEPIVEQPSSVMVEKESLYVQENREEKAQRLQWLLQQLFRETLQENNKELSQLIKESVLKELDYQFRIQEEKEDERHTERTKRDEEHYKKIDELLRKKRRLIK